MSQVPMNREGMNVPAFMDGTDGTESLSQYIIPPRMKIVQKQSGSPFDERFNPGDVIVVPQMLQITDKEKPFYFLPIFFYPEWCVWNPIQMRGTLPVIRERTLDPNHPLVAKSRDPKLWSEPCPESPEYALRIVEHLNFVVLLLGDVALSDTPVVVSFMRAEHRCGSNLAALIRMRKAPIFGCQFEAHVGHRENQKGSWFGIDVGNPSDQTICGSFVEDEIFFEHCRELHEQYKSSHEASKIVVEYDEGTEEVPGDSTDTEF